MRIQISSGQGPEECELAAAKLYEQIKMEAGDVRLSCCVPGRKREGFSSVIFETDCDLTELEGSVLWICKSPYRPGHRRKNWYINVSILEQVPRVTKEKQVRYETFRSSGKGGQHVNKVETGVRIIHIPTGITVVSTEARSQYRNKKIAEKRLDRILDQMNQESGGKEKNMAWREHTCLERGNPVRIYEGSRFIRRK